MYSLSTFLKPLTNTDTVAQIRTTDLTTVYTLSPYLVKNVTVINNLIRVNLNSLKDIVLDFSTSNEAIQGAALLESAIDTLRNKPPLYIDKIVKEYINDITIGPTGPQGFQGPQGPTGPQYIDGLTGTFSAWVPYSIITLTNGIITGLA